MRWVLRGGVGGTCSQTLTQLTAPFSADADDPEFNATKPKKAKTEEVKRQKDDEEPDWSGVVEKLDKSGVPATTFHNIVQECAVPNTGKAFWTLSVVATQTAEQKANKEKPKRVEVCA